MRRFLKLAGVIVVLGCLFVVWAMLDLRVRKSFAPARPDISFHEFSASHTVKFARTFESEGKQYFEALGQIPKGAFFYAPSGPPAYVFDSGGRLVDWTPDRGDASRYLKKWGTFSAGTKIDVAELDRLLGGTNGVRGAAGRDK